MYNKVTAQSIRKEMDMPSSTFFNLPHEKRERILSRCFAEFTKHSYQGASVSKVVDELGISKGSMYKYFVNKQDLYLYLVQQAAAVKLNYLAASLQTDSDSFFDNLWSVVKTGVEFDINYPQYSLFLGRVCTDEDALADNPVSRQLISRSYSFIRDLVLSAQERGDVRHDLSADLISYLINNTIVNYADMVTKKFDLSQEKLLDKLNQNDTSQDLNKEYVLAELKSLLNMIRTGIEK